VISRDTDSGRDEGASHGSHIPDQWYHGSPTVGFIDVGVWAVISSISYRTKVAANVNKVSRQAS